MPVRTLGPGILQPVTGDMLCVKAALFISRGDRIGRPMNPTLRMMLLFGLVVSLPVVAHSQATATSSSVDPAIVDLAGRLSTSLDNAGKKRVVVLDLRGPQKEIHPLGTWLADQLSSALKSNADGLEVVDRSEIKRPCRAR